MKVSGQFQNRHLVTKVIKKIEEVPADEWNKIFPHVPESYYFLKTLDESNFEQFSFHYILVYEHKELGPHAGHSSILVGAAPCFTRSFPELFNIKALVCGIPMGQGQIGLTGFSSAILEAIEQRMEVLACKVNASVIAFKDFEGPYDHFFVPLLKKDFIKINGLPTTRLNLNFSDFEDYLQTLSSATRYDLRRKLKKASSIKIDSSIESAPDETTLNEVYSLYLQAAEKHNKDLAPLPPDFFSLISKNMPQETKFFLWRINGKLAAFVFCVVSEDVLLDYYWGFDYTPAHEYHLYFVKFKEVFNWCLANGIKTYEMGARGYEPKRRLKFELVPVHLYVKSRLRILRPLLKCLCALLKFSQCFFRPWINNS